MSKRGRYLQQQVVVIEVEVEEREERGRSIRGGILGILKEGGFSKSMPWVSVGTRRVRVKGPYLTSELEEAGALHGPFSSARSPLCFLSCSSRVEPPWPWTSLLLPASRPASWASPSSEEWSSSNIGVSAKRQDLYQRRLKRGGPTSAYTWSRHGMERLVAIILGDMTFISGRLLPQIYLFRARRCRAWSTPRTAQEFFKVREVFALTTGRIESVQGTWAC